jgi:hypothetical protein
MGAFMVVALRIQSGWCSGHVGAEAADLRRQVLAGRRLQPGQRPLRGMNRYHPKMTLNFSPKFIQ